MDILTDNEINGLQQAYGSSSLETSTADLLLDPVVEGVQASPVFQAIDFAASGYLLEGNMTGADANLKFELEGTDAAFDPEDSVNDSYAKYVSDRYSDRQILNARREEVSEQYGAVTSSVTGFMGNLAGGMVDPINLVLGIGGNMAMRKLGMYTAESIAKSTTMSISKEAAKRYTRNTLIQSVGENLVVNTATEYSFGKLQEFATNREISTKDRVFGIMAGTVLGAGIQTGMTHRQLGKLVKREEIKASQITETYGAASEEIMDKTHQHAINAEANGVKSNPEFVKQKIHAELYDTRSYQTEYKFEPLDDFSIGGTKFYKLGAKGDAPVADFYTNDFGVGFSDNYNHIHNTASRTGVEVDKKMTVDHFDVSKASVMDNANFVQHKGAMMSKFRTKLADVMEMELTGATYNKSKKSLSTRSNKFLDKLGEDNNISPKKLNNMKTDLISAIEGSENIAQFKEAFEKMAFDRKEWSVDGDQMIKSIFQDMRFEGLDLGTSVKGIDDVFNHALEAAGDFGEFRMFTKQMFAESDFDVNVDKMLRESLHEMGFDGVHMVANVGEPNAHNMVYMFEPSLKKAKRLERGDITPLDMAQETALGDKLKKMELDEMDRFENYKQKTDYIEEFDNEADAVIAKFEKEDKVLMDNADSEMEALGLKDLDDTAVKVEGEVKKLDELNGIRESIKANEDVSIVKKLTACIFKGKA